MLNAVFLTSIKHLKSPFYECFDQFKLAFFLLLLFYWCIATFNSNLLICGVNPRDVMQLLSFVLYDKHAQPIFEVSATVTLYCLFGSLLVSKAQSTQQNLKKKKSKQFKFHTVAQAVEQAKHIDTKIHELISHMR